MGSIANFGDGPTRDWHSIAPLMYRLAAEYRGPLAQWLAEAPAPRATIRTRAMYDLLWYDPTLPRRSARRPCPTWHAFSETGFAGARTGWGDDAITLHLRSGKADVSHSHLDVNDFLLNVGGEWLLRDYGYGKVGPGYFNQEVDYFSNDTVGHNCLVIGGRNQRKDDAQHRRHHRRAAKRTASSGSAPTPPSAMRGPSRWCGNGLWSIPTRAPGNGAIWWCAIERRSRLTQPSNSCFSPAGQ